MSKRQNVSMLVSAAGWVGSFVGELIPALRERGISDELIHAFVMDNGKISIGKIADVMAEDILNAGENYPVVFDYSEPIENKVTAGQYNHSNSYIISGRFLTNRTGIVESSIRLFHFGYRISSEEAIRKMNNGGYRPVEACELLDFGKRYPDVQRKFPIIALGSVWDADKSFLRSRRVVCLDSGGDGSDRLVRLPWFDDNWFDGCRFAAVRK